MKEAGDLQIRETQFNSANLVQEVVEGVQSALQQPDEDQSQDLIQHLAKNAAQQQLMPQMMELLKQMSTVQQQIQSQSASSTVTSNTTSSSSRRRRHRTNISFYCWSHGACAHPSPECKNKRPGHQDAVTFDNKLGGSIAFCIPTTNGTQTN